MVAFLTLKIHNILLMSTSIIKDRWILGSLILECTNNESLIAKNLSHVMNEDSILKTKVQTLLDSSITLNYITLLSQIKDILTRWTHADIQPLGCNFQTAKALSCSTV